MARLGWLRGRRSDEEDFWTRSALTSPSPRRSVSPRAAIEETRCPLKDFGNVTLTTEAARRVWTPRWVEAGARSLSDVRYAIRALAKNAGFSLAVITVLAVGVGLNATVFTLLKSLALSPLSGVEGRRAWPLS